MVNERKLKPDMADYSQSDQQISRQHDHHEKSMTALDLKTAVFEGVTKEDIDKYYYQNVIEATAGPKPKKGSFQ